MQFNNTEVFNFEGALRGMRNPMNSWDKSDSYFGIIDLRCPQDMREEVVDAWVTQELVRKGKEVEPYNQEWEELFDAYDTWLWDVGVLKWDRWFKSDIALVAHLGPNDLELAQKLILAGDEHAKFMRQIFVSVDITAPIYYWKEMDTYKVGTTANSTSTMHKLTSTPITKEMFEWDESDDLIVASGTAPHSDGWEFTFNDFIEDIIDTCERLRQKYLTTHNEQYWRALIQYLPQSYLQTRTWTANYAVLRNIYFQRRNHRLKEWHKFCNWVESLPYGKELITLEENK